MAQNLVRVQEKGQITLPATFRKKLGLKKGDLVAVLETDAGMLITPQWVLASAALDRIGEALRERGLSLDELIASGREIRGELVRERYGLDPDDKPDLRSSPTAAFSFPPPSPPPAAPATSST